MLSDSSRTANDKDGLSDVLIAAALLPRCRESDTARFFVVVQTNSGSSECERDS